MQIGDKRKLRKFECTELEQNFFYSTTKYVAHLIYVQALTANKQKKHPKTFQIDAYVFVFQTPSAVQKIKQLLKDKPEHVSINRANL